MQIELHQQAALEFLLLKEYKKEWNHEGHTEGLNFYQWLYKKKLISKEHLDNWMKEIKEECDE